MAEGTCSVDGCSRIVRCVGLCKNHYDAGRLARSKRRCSIEGCDKPHYGRGWCVMHLARWRRHGDPLFTMLRPGENLGTDSNGYRTLTLPADHPLRQGASGHARQHRVVMFDSIGYGPHRCHWCDKPINWGAGLEVDHVDEDKSNNDPTNLVQSCHRCNSARSYRLHPERKLPNRWLNRPRASDPTAA